MYSCFQCFVSFTVHCSMSQFLDRSVGLFLRHTRSKSIPAFTFGHKFIRSALQRFFTDVSMFSFTHTFFGFSPSLVSSDLYYQTMLFTIVCITGLGHRSKTYLQIISLFTVITANTTQQTHQTPNQVINADKRLITYCYFFQKRHRIHRKSLKSLFKVIETYYL